MDGELIEKMKKYSINLKKDKFSFFRKVVALFMFKSLRISLQKNILNTIFCKIHMKIYYVYYSQFKN